MAIIRQIHNWELENTWEVDGYSKGAWSEWILIVGKTSDHSKPYSILSLKFDYAFWLIIFPISVWSFSLSNIIFSPLIAPSILFDDHLFCSILIHCSRDLPDWLSPQTGPPDKRRVREEGSFFQNIPQRRFLGFVQPVSGEQDAL